MVVRGLHVVSSKCPFCVLTIPSIEPENFPFLHGGSLQGRTMQGVTVCAAFEVGGSIELMGEDMSGVLEDGCALVIVGTVMTVGPCETEVRE